MLYSPQWVGNAANANCGGLENGEGCHSGHFGAPKYFDPAFLTLPTRPSQCASASASAEDVRFASVSKLCGRR